LIIFPAKQGHFFQPGKNSLLLKQLAGLQKRHCQACTSDGIDRNDDQGP
jgi:hypothetical protein